MLSKLDEFLSPFRSCFSREKSFSYFCLVIIAFMVLTDDKGVTSFIRILFLDPRTYDGLLHFFNSDSYDLEEILKKWIRIVSDSPQAKVVRGRGILIGDHTKFGKEGRRMPAMKAHHQNSENLGKPETIFGYHFGMLGMLIDRGGQNFCAPLKLRIHEGAEEAEVWQGREPKGRAFRLISEALSASSCSQRDNYLILDRDFLSIEGIKAVRNQEASSGGRLDLIGRCKRNVVCQRELTEAEKAADRKSGRRGRPRKYTEPVRPADWFETRRDDFVQTVLEDGSSISLYSCIEYWNGMPLLFVLSIEDGRRAIFYSTDLDLSAREAVELYKLRFSIEMSFNGLKYLVHGFSFHFWVKGFEKLTKFSKDRLRRVPEELRPRVLRGIRRIERFVNFAGMAYGLLQFMTLEFGGESSPAEIRYQRTYRHPDQLSVEQFQELFSRNFPFLLQKNPESLIAKIIRQFSRDDEISKLAA